MPKGLKGGKKLSHMLIKLSLSTLLMTLISYNLSSRQIYNFLRGHSKNFSFSKKIGLMNKTLKS